jgi:uncharacterized protein YndB with AHSA1/START domain
VLKTTPAKLYRAFTEAGAMASWFPPYGYYCTVHEMDARTGGRYRMSFTNFSTGNSHSFLGEFLEMKPDALLRYTDQFENSEWAGVMTTTVQLRPVTGGTELRIVQEGIPDAIPTDLCYIGWQESLEKLARLVEPEIADE